MKKITLISLLSVSILVGCSQQSDPNELVSQANELIEQKNYKSATIALKNALKINPKMSQARFLLGKSYLKIGLVDSAEKEINQALELGYDINLALPLLARTQTKLGKAFVLGNFQDPLISELTKLKINSIIGITLLSQGQYALAFKANKDALSSNISDDFHFKLSQTAIAAFDDQIHEAIENSKLLSQQDSEFQDAYLLYAILLQINKQYEKSAHAFEQILQNQADYFVQLNYLRALINSDQYDIAGQRMSALLKVSSRDPNYNEIKAELSLRSNNYEIAAQHATEAIAINSNSLRAHFIAGVSHYFLDNSEQSYLHLSKVESHLVKNTAAYKMLIKLKFQLGYTDAAIDTLDTITTLKEDDFDLFANASFKLINQHRANDASKYVSNLNNITTEQPDLLLKKEILEFSLNTQNDLQDIQNIIKKNPNFAAARVALYSAYIEKNELTKALSAAEDWVTEFPNAEGGYLARGVVQLFQGQLKLAKQNIEHAYKINPKSIVATFMLSTFDITDRNFESAYHKLTSILEVKPEHKPSLNRLFSISHNADIRQNAINFLQQKIIKYQGLVAVPNLLPMQITLAKLYLIDNKAQLGSKLLVPLYNQAKQDKEYLQSLALTHYYNGEFFLAEEIFVSILQRADVTLLDYLKLLQVLESQDKYITALKYLKSSQSYFEDKNDYVFYKCYLLIKAEKFSEAEQHLNNIVETPKNNLSINRLKRELYTANADFFKARKAAEILFNNKQDIENTYIFAKILIQTKQYEYANTIVQNYLKNNVRTSKLTRLEAEINLFIHPQKALNYYLNKNKLQPNQFITLNNIAWAALKLGDTEVALEKALEAKNIAKDHPQVNDTLALIYMKTNQFTLASPLLEQALKKLPNDQGIILHYAETLIHLDKASKAKLIMTKLEESPEKNRLFALINSQDK